MLLKSLNSVGQLLKSIDFYYSKLVKNQTDVSIEEWPRYDASKDAFDPLYKECFDPDIPSSKIKATDTDYETVLKDFLKFMEEADAGFNLFDAKDPNDVPLLKLLKN